MPDGLGSKGLECMIENPDEIVLENVKMFHLENMTEDVYWCGIYLNDGRIFHLHIGGDNLRISLSDETPDELA